MVNSLVNKIQKHPYSNLPRGIDGVGTTGMAISVCPTVWDQVSVSRP
jgi:hypothetical protein